MHAVEVDHLYKSYGTIKAVTDLSFKAPVGNCLALLGPNGAGKTTAIKTIYGKAQCDPHSNTRIQVFGYDPRTHLLKVKVHVGVVSQDNNLDAELNVYQNLAIYARFNGMTRAQSRDRINELLAFMELKERGKAQVRELSGGMQRRLAIARALVSNPRLIILDEPTTGLDLQVRQLIWDRLRALMQQGVTILLTTHYMEEAYQLAHAIVIMNEGRKKLEGNPKTLIRTHLERYVMETEGHIDLGHATTRGRATRGRATRGRATRGRATPEVRHEHTETYGLYYCNTRETLEKIAKDSSLHQYHIRESNLEDLFLHATGRNLNVQQ